MRIFDDKGKLVVVLTLLAGIITLLPFLGLAEFNTKGEPREAVVAVSMLNQHNWILPVNNGIEIPYKPPFFQWCIALFSLPAGHVSEFTARLPSALALILMAVCGACFSVRRSGWRVALLAAMLVLTNFELHRAGTNCRVDMVLTAFVVCALYALYVWWEPKQTAGGSVRKRCGGLPWLAILLMSCATLTKGPVGIVLPLMVMFFFLLFTAWRDRSLCVSSLWHICWKLGLSAVLACVVPAVWYVLAYQQGGKEFLDLVADENVGRFLGRMKFVTHDQPWPYNILTLITGWLPWTLPIVFSLFVLPWRRWASAAREKSQLLSAASLQSERLREAMKNVRPVQVFTWLSFLLIFVFYCIPRSKRSVYLMPCYPFMAVLMAEYAQWLIRKHHEMPQRLLTALLTAVGIIVPLLFVGLRLQLVPDSIFHGRHAYENILILHAFSTGRAGFTGALAILLAAVAACVGLAALLRRRVCGRSIGVLPAAVVIMLLINISLDAYLKPAALNVRSYRPFAAVIDSAAAGRQIYAFTGFSEPGSDPLRFYGADFYLDDCMRQFAADRPAKGVLVVNDGSRAQLDSAFARKYSFEKIYKSAHRETEFKDTIYIYTFRRR